MIGTHDHSDGHDHGHAHNVPSRVDPVVGIPAVLAFIIIAASTPREAHGAFAGFGVIALLVLGLSPTPWRVLIRRLLGIAIAALLAAGPLALFEPPAGQDTSTVRVLGVDLYNHGLLTLFRVWAVGTLAVSAVTWLGSVVPAHEVLAGLRRLRCPALIVALAGFVQRFGGLIAEEAGRMRRAMRARGHGVVWAWRAAPLGGAAGMLFLRSLGRAERVHGAMRLRGYGGTWAMADSEFRIDRRQAAVAAMVLGVALGIRLVAA